MVRVCVLLALSVVLLAASAAEAEARRCRGADIGYTDAAVRAEGVGCRTARSVVSGWSRKVARLNKRGKCRRRNNFCRRIGYRGFTCVTKGTKGGGVVRLRCVDGGRVIRARWGD